MQDDPLIDRPSKLFDSARSATLFRRLELQLIVPFLSLPDTFAWIAHPPSSHLMHALVTHRDHLLAGESFEFIIEDDRIPSPVRRRLIHAHLAGRRKSEGVGAALDSDHDSTDLDGALESGDLFISDRLSWAIRNLHADRVEMFLSFDATLANSANGTFWGSHLTSLCHLPEACIGAPREKERARLVRMLLDSGADVLAGNDAGVGNALSALFDQARVSPSLEIMRILLAANPLAATTEHVLVRALLPFVAENLVDDCTCVLLWKHKFDEESIRPVVKLLLENGADFNDTGYELLQRDDGVGESDDLFFVDGDIQNGGMTPSIGSDDGDHTHHLNDSSLPWFDDEPRYLPEEIASPNHQFYNCSPYDIAVALNFTSIVELITTHRRKRAQ